MTLDDYISSPKVVQRSSYSVSGLLPWQVSPHYFFRPTQGKVPVCASKIPVVSFCSTFFACWTRRLSRKMRSLLKFLMFKWIHYCCFLLLGEYLSSQPTSMPKTHFSILMWEIRTFLSAFLSNGYMDFLILIIEIENHAFLDPDFYAHINRQWIQLVLERFQVWVQIYEDRN